MTSVTIAIGTPMRRANAILLRATLEHHDWDKSATAKTLKVSLSTVYAWIREHGLRPPGGNSRSRDRA